MRQKRECRTYQEQRESIEYKEIKKFYEGVRKGLDIAEEIFSCSNYESADGTYRDEMCIRDSNNCYKKKTCADCQYCFENKDVDCNLQGIQGCKYKVDYQIVGKSDERM